jgi:hypothetical protein
MSFCSEQYPDDANLSDSSSLFRRIPPWHVFYDENLRRWGPSSAAFEDDDDGDPMSVYLGSVLADEKREPTDVLQGHDGFSLASITAGLARINGQTVHPKPEATESSHAVVCGDKGRKNKSAPKRQFAANAVWIVMKQPA